MIKFTLIFILAFLSLTMTSCVQKPKKIVPQKSPQSAQKIYDNAKTYLQKKNFKNALKLSQKIISQYPQSDLQDDAYMMSGDIFFEESKFGLSYENYMYIVDSPLYSPLEGEAIYKAAKSLVKISRNNEALALTDRAQHLDHISPLTSANILSLRYTIFYSQGDLLDALKSLAKLSQVNLVSHQKQKFHIKGLELLNTKLSDKELTVVASDSDFFNFRAYAYYKLGSQYYEKKDFSQATTNLSQALELLPTGSFAENAQDKINQLHSRNVVNPTTIGVILPLTGRYEKMAQKVLRGLQLGLGVYGGTQRSQFSLAILDSQQNPDVARRAVEELVSKDNVIALVGSLLTKTSVAVATKADELGIPNISLSQKPGITQIGKYVFRNTITAEMQVKHLVYEAIHNRKLKKFAILFPNDPYGVEYTNLFWDEVLAQGGDIVGAQSYAPKETNFSEPLRRLVGTFYYEDRLDEYKELLNNWYKKQKYLSSRITPPSDLLPPIIEFDALFIPDSTKSLGQISPTLSYLDIDDVHLIGTNLWNHHSFLQRAGKFHDKSFFVDVVLNKDPEFINTEFYRIYKKTFNMEPSIFEAQAYDIGLILRQLIISGARTRVDLARSINEIYKFNGSFGELQINNMREIIRPLFTLEVQDQNITKVSR